MLQRCSVVAAQGPGASTKKSFRIMTTRETEPVVPERERAVASSSAVMPVTHLTCRPQVAIIGGRLVAVQHLVPVPSARR